MRFKKISVVMVLMLLVVNVFGTFAYADNSIDIKTESTIRKQIIEIYSNDPQFKMMVEEYGEKAGNEFIDNKVESEINAFKLKQDMLISPYGQQYSIYYCTVPLKQQINSYYCGPASVLQTLYGMNLQGLVSGGTDSAKQSTLGTNMGTTTDGTMVYKVAAELNKYVSTKQYTYTTGSSKTLSEFKISIANSLKYDRPVILHAMTQHLPYYNGYSTGHYISLDSVDTAYDQVQLKDCNNNSNYYGAHMVSLTEAKDSVSDTGRYYICY